MGSLSCAAVKTPRLRTPAFESTMSHSDVGLTNGIANVAKGPAQHSVSSPSSCWLAGGVRTVRSGQDESGGCSSAGGR